MERRRAQIRIKSIQHDIEDHVEENVYYGYYAYLGGKHLLSYEENMESAVIKNLYKISEDSLLLSKNGAITTKMLFDISKKYQNIYKTPHGSFDLLLKTKKIRVEVLEEKIDVFLNYDLFLNQNFISNCTIELTCDLEEVVKEERE